MKKQRNQPITGATPQYQRQKPPIVPDAKDTSSDEQRFISEAPTPFKNKMQTPNIPAASAAPGGVSTLEPSIKSGMKRSTVGARALPQRGPVGQRKPINQSGQMNGRFGTSFPRKVGVSPSGFSAKRNATFYGE